MNSTRRIVDVTNVRAKAFLGWCSDKQHALSLENTLLESSDDHINVLLLPFLYISSNLFQSWQAILCFLVRNSIPECFSRSGQHLFLDCVRLPIGKNIFVSFLGKISRSIGIHLNHDFASLRTLFSKLCFSLVYPYSVLRQCLSDREMYLSSKFSQANYSPETSNTNIITKSQYDAHTSSTFCKFKLLTLKQIYNLQAGLFMFFGR